MGAGDRQPVQQVRGFAAANAEVCRGPLRTSAAIAPRSGACERRFIGTAAPGIISTAVRNRRRSRDAAAQDLDGGDQARLERELRIDRRERRIDRRHVERGLEHGLDEAVLVGKDAEDGALRDPGGFGDLAGGDGGAVRQEERQGGGDDLGPALRGGSAAARARLGPGSSLALGGAGGTTCLLGMGSRLDE